jgi:hypothetical protein
VNVFRRATLLCHLQARKYSFRRCQHGVPLPSVQASPRAEICEDCGEVYHDPKVTRALLDQADFAAKNGVEIDVIKYASA